MTHEKLQNEKESLVYLILPPIPQRWYSC